MKSLHAFIKKETMEQFRSGRLMILGILFVLLGVMNPAVAKITPWLLEILADGAVEQNVIVKKSESRGMRLSITDKRKGDIR